MAGLFSFLRKQFCFCGLSQEEYEEVKPLAYVSNFRVWQYLHIFIAICMVMLLGVHISVNGISVQCLPYFGMLVYSTLVGILFFTVFEEDSLIAQLIIYLTMVLLLIFTLRLQVNQPERMAPAFIVMLVTLPMFMIDKPYFMALTLSLATGIFLCAIHPVVRTDVYEISRLYAILFGVLGFAINWFYNTVRIREFRLQWQQKAYLENQYNTSLEMQRLNTSLQQMSSSVVDLLGDMVENRNFESGEHIGRVKGFVRILATCVMRDLPEYHLTKHDVDLMAFTSALHDVGKIAIPDAILCKPGRLTEEEFAVMKTHCEKGAEIIGKMADTWSPEYMNMSRDIALYHHEKWDGKGYPKGLKGDQIPIAAQIVSIADIYDALTSHRVYKEAYDFDTAVRMIKEGECGAFSDPLMRCFLKCADSFRAHALGQDSPATGTAGVGAGKDFLQKWNRSALQKKVSVLQSLAEEYFYICHVNMQTNEVTRFSADARLLPLLNSFGNLPSRFLLDKLLNSIVLPMDYPAFRKATHREIAVAQLKAGQNVIVRFHAGINGGVYLCEMKIAPDPSDPNSVVLGLINRQDTAPEETV